MRQWKVCPAEIGLLSLVTLSFPPLRSAKVQPLSGLRRLREWRELELKLGERFVAGSVKRGRLVFDPYGHSVGQELHESQVAAAAIGSLLVVAKHLMYLCAAIRLVGP